MSIISAEPFWRAEGESCIDGLVAPFLSPCFISLRPQHEVGQRSGFLSLWSMKGHTTRFFSQKLFYCAFVFKPFLLEGKKITLETRAFSASGIKENQHNLTFLSFLLRFGGVNQLCPRPGLQELLMTSSVYFAPCCYHFLLQLSLIMMLV